MRSAYPWVVVAVAVLGGFGCHASVASGSWSGTLVSPHSLALRFDIDDHDGALTGRSYFEDPVTKAYEPEAALTGKRDDQHATWTTEAGVKVIGKFDGNSFAGSMTFPADGDEPAHTAEVKLVR